MKADGVREGAGDEVRGDSGCEVGVGGVIDVVGVAVMEPLVELKFGIDEITQDEVGVNKSNRQMELEVADGPVLLVLFSWAVVVSSLLLFSSLLLYERFALSSASQPPSRIVKNAFLQHAASGGCDAAGCEQQLFGV